MRPRLGAASALLLLATGCAGTRTVPVLRELRRPYWSGTFRSGLRLVVYQDPTPGRFDLVLSYGAGAAADPAGKEGLAELTQLLTERAQARGPATPDRRDRMRASSVSATRWVTSDEMIFEAQGPTSLLDGAIGIEAERLAAPLDGIDDGALVLARDELFRERARGQGRWRTELLAVLGASLPGHPYGRAALATADSLRAARMADVAAFAREHLRPSNAILVVATDQDALATARRIAERLGPVTAPGPQGSIAPSPPVAPPPVQPAAVPPGIDVRTGSSDRPRLWLTWVAPGVRSREWPSAVMATQLTQIAVLWRLVFWREGRARVRDVHPASALMAGAQLSGLVFDLASAADAGPVIEEVRDVLKSDERGRRSIERAAERGPAMAKDLAMGRGPGLATVAALIRAGHGADYVAATRVMLAGQLAPQDVTRILAEDLSPARMRATLFTPAEAKHGGEPALRMPAVPEPQPPGPTFEPPDGAAAAALVRSAAVEVSRRTLENRLTWITARRSGATRLALELAVPFPPASGGEAGAGLRALALATTTQRWPYSSHRPCPVPRGIAAGEQVAFRAAGDRALLLPLLRRLRCATDGTAVAETAFERRRDDLAGALRTGTADPVERAEAEFCRAVTPGPGCPGRPAPEAVEELRPRDAEEWLASAVRPERSVLVVAGEPAPETERAVAEILGAWTVPALEAGPSPEPPRPARRRALVVAVPGARDAWVRVGVRGPRAGSRDRVAAIALRALLEGRMYADAGLQVIGDVRVELVERAGLSALTVAAPVTRGSAGAVVERFVAALVEAARTPLARREAGVARWEAARAVAWSRWTEADAAAALAAEAARGDVEPPDLAADVAALGPERIQAAARAMDLGAPVVVAAGDPASLGSQLRAAGFEVEVVEAAPPPASTAGTPASPPG